MEIFNGELFAIAGSYTRVVEVMKGGQWENMMPVGNRNGSLDSFSSLKIPGNPADAIFVFGIYVLSFFILTTIISGGEEYHYRLKKVWRYDNEQWKKYHPLRTPRSHHQTARIGNNIFHIGGYQRPYYINDPYDHSANFRLK